MKFSIFPRDLEKALSDLNNVVAKSSANPLHKMIKVTVEANKLILFAGDGFISLLRVIPVEDASPGVCALPGKSTLDLVKGLSNDHKVKMALFEDTRIKVSHNRSKYSLSGAFPEDMILPPYPPLDSYSTLCSESLVTAISKVDHATGTDLTPAFCAIYFEPSGEEGFMRAVATDGKRLSTCKVTGVLSSPVLITKKTTNLIKKLATKDDCGFFIKDSMIFVRLGDSILQARLPISKFPNYRQIIPTGERVEIVLDRESFLMAVKRILLFSTDGKISIILEDSKCTFTSRSTLGEGQEELTLESPVKNKMIIYLNGEFLQQTLTAIDDPSPKLLIFGEMSSMVILGAPSMMGLIMPMKG